MEFFGSFLFVFCWILIRNFEFKGNFSRLANLVKPIFVALIYNGCWNLCKSTTLGPLNPILAIEMGVWSAIAYNDPSDQAPSNTKMSIFTYLHYGRYIWTYVIAPIVAAILAGLLARAHLANLSYNALESSSIYESSGPKQLLKEERVPTEGNTSTPYGDQTAFQH